MFTSASVRPLHSYNILMLDQASILGPILFNLFINDLILGQSALLKSSQIKKNKWCEWLTHHSDRS